MITRQFIFEKQQGFLSQQGHPWPYSCLKAWRYPAAMMYSLVSLNGSFSVTTLETSSKKRVFKIIIYNKST